MRHLTLATAILVSLFSVTLAHADTTIPHGTQLTGNVTWTKAAGPYIVLGMGVASDATLTIEPGTVIKFLEGGGIGLNGTVTIGAPLPAEPVIFTSLKDDSAGGDTNADGIATSPAPGNWNGVYVSTGTTTVVNTIIRYGGRFGNMLVNQGGVLSLTHSELAYAQGDAFRQSLGTSTISNAAIRDASIGLNIIGGQLTLATTTFHHIANNSAVICGCSLFINQGGNSGARGFFIQGTITRSTTWVPDGLPYIFYSGGTGQGADLAILPGTIVKFELGGGIGIGGNLTVGDGMNTTPVIFTSIRDDSVGGDTNGDGDSTSPAPADWNGLYVVGSGTITNAILRYGGSFQGALNNAGTLTVAHTKIEHSRGKNFAQTGGHTTMSHVELQHAEYGIHVTGGSLVVNDSSIHNHSQYGVYNGTTNVIDATRNWWGSATGPRHVSNPLGTGDRITNHVNFGGWLTEEPGQECLSECYSVLFIPGLAGSKLYRDSDNVWFPDRDQDARELFLSELGVSINSDVTVKAGEVAESAYLLEDIYAGLPELLDTLKSTRVIADWKSTPYDWRLDYDVLLAGGKQTGDRVNYALGTSTPYIIQTLQQLANKAKTHKVIIITHSNGGLLAKALVKKLEENNDPLRDGIAQVIIVAAPQLGAPKAIASMLHGDENPLSTKRWDIVENDTFRQLVENMPNMYNLLPSDQFVNTATGPYILFDNPDDEPYDRAGKKAILEYGHYDTDQTLNTYRARYPDGISTIAQLYAFITGEGGLRDKPDADDLDTPNVLSEVLLANARNTHAEIDSYLFPSSIKVTQVVGWGLPTITGLEYHRNTDDPDCIEHFPCKVSYRMGRGPITTTDGDKTVPSLSATAMLGAQTVWVNLNKYNENIESTDDSAKSRDHSSIMGSQPIKQLLSSLITGDTIDTIPYTSATKPSGAKYMMIEKHSPVDLDLYDNEGNHTGFIDVLIDGTLHRMIEEEIPGSSYIIMGSSSFVFFPTDTPTTITMYGTATGSATIKITERIDDVITATTTFFHIPIRPTTVGTITLSSLASTSPLVIDNDGNGSAELTLTPVLNGAILADPIIDQIQLTLTPDNKTTILGSPTPQLSVTLSGFVEGDTMATSMSGTPSCATTATSGSPVGSYPIICSAGTLSSEKYKVETFASGTLTILYKWPGFQQPINDTAYNPTQTMSVFKGGSTVPVKFQLKNTNGTPVQSSTSPIWLSPQRGGAMSATIDESTYPATSGSTFKWDSASQHYVYNWSTKGLAAGYWYRIYAKLEDGTTQSVVVGLR